MMPRQSGALFSFLFVSALLPGSAQAESPAGLTPGDALRIAQDKNPSIAVAQAKADSESALIWSASWLDRPRVGFMHEQNLNNMQVQMGPMLSWSVSQEVKFPLKYVFNGTAQASRARAARYEAQDKSLEIRAQVLTAYYRLYAARRIANLLEAQRETLREIARVAEARRATGAVPQQDEMKAHVEQTRIENEILLQSQETSEAEANFRSLLNLEAAQEIGIAEKDLPAPKITSREPVAKLLERSARGSRVVLAGEALSGVAQNEKALAWLSLTPDFMMSYRQAFVNAPANAYAFSIEASIPLWFFTKEVPEISAARARAVGAEAELDRTKRETESETRSLGTKVESYESLLRIYETSLIPQSISMLNSSRAAYSAGRTTFIELLDSERSLYANRIAYYQTLSKFVESVTKLERTIGGTMSDLPFFEENLK